MALPVDAAEYVKRAGLPGPVFNHLNLGGYLIGALPRRCSLTASGGCGEEFYNAIGAFRLAGKPRARRREVRLSVDHPALHDRAAPDAAEFPPTRAGVWRMWTIWLWSLCGKARRQAMVDRSTVERPAPAAPDLSALSGLGGRSALRLLSVGCRG